MSAGLIVYYFPTMTALRAWCKIKLRKKVLIRIRQTS